MSLYFIINNLHFTIELVGALVFFMMAWLAADAYMVGKQLKPLLRIIGFSLIGLWQILYAFTLGGDFINTIGSFVYLIGIGLVILSFFVGPRLSPVSTTAVILIPAFSSVLPYIDAIAALGFGAIAYLSYKEFKREFNQSLKFFWYGFSVLAIASLFSSFLGSTSVGSLIARLLQAAGFIVLVMWVWQYLKLRLRESMVLIFISMTLFIATIVTLAFSTILISKIESETRNNLTIDTRVLDLTVRGLTEEASAKAKLLGQTGEISTALAQNNISELERLMTVSLDKEKLGFLLVTDKNGLVVLRAHALTRRGDSVGNERAVEEALGGTNFATIESSPGEKFSIRASVPLYRKGEIVGVLVAGFPLDNVFADRMKKITGLEMSVYDKDTVVATTALGADGRTRLSGISINDQSVKSAVLEKGEAATARVLLRGESFLASYLPVINADGKIVGMFSASKPQQDIMALANATNRLTFVTVIILLLILALPLYFLTRRLLGSAL